MIRSFTLAAFAAALAFAALPVVSAHAVDGKIFGKGVTGAEVVKVSELMAHPDKYVGKLVRVEGLITDVCAKGGCWMNSAGDKELQSIRIKVSDGDIVFPLEAKGKGALAEGTFTKIEVSKDDALKMAQHHAEEKGEKFDPAKAKDLPTVIYQIAGTGAVIK